MRTIPLLGRRSKYGAALVFSLFIVITSFYQYIPEKAAYAFLKIPYILLLCLGIAVIGRLFRNTYRLSRLPAFIFVLAALLTCVYGFVSIWRFVQSGYEAARPSLYLAMASILGIVMFFAADSGTFPLKYKSLNLVIISSELNIMQLVIGAVTFGGIRSSSLLENIMVYDCFMLALIPQLFQTICRKSSGKRLRILAELNVVAGASIVLISGARSAVLLLIPVLLFSAIVCCVKCRIRWGACGAIFLSIAVCVATMAELDLYSARTSIERVAGWSLYSGENTPNVSDEQPQDTLDKGKSGFDFLPSAAASASIQASNGMRQALWKSSMEEIKKSPIIGTGTVYFDCQFGEIILQEGSHNFILEMWLIFGGMGLLIIGAMMAGLFLWGLKNLLKRRDGAIWMLLSAGGILALAMVQPLMSMVTVTSFFWVLAGYGHRNQAEARLA